jgi:26S proteasome regulatory subunit N2
MVICYRVQQVINFFGIFSYIFNVEKQYSYLFRDNLEWLARATNWAKFTAAASLGVIHKGHIKEALNLMSAYLPKDSTGNSPYAEGGGLYALGLIHANHGGDIIEYLINQLRTHSTQTDVCKKKILI